MNTTSVLQANIVFGAPRRGISLRAHIGRMLAAITAAPALAACGGGDDISTEQARPEFAGHEGDGQVDGGANARAVALNAAVQPIEIGADGSTCLGASDITMVGAAAGQGVVLDSGSGRPRAPGLPVVASGAISAVTADADDCLSVVASSAASPSQASSSPASAPTGLDKGRQISKALPLANRSPNRTRSAPPEQSVNPPSLALYE